MKNLSTKSQGIILVFIGMSFVALADVCIKNASLTYDIFTIALYMNIFTGIAILPLVLINGGFKRVLSTKSLKFHALRSLTMLGGFLCIIYSLSILPIATVYVISFTSPFIINIMAKIFLKEKISPYRWLAIILGFLGIIISIRPEIFPFGLMMIFVFIKPFLSATSTLLTKFINKKDHWLSYSLLLIIFQTPFLIVIVYFINGSIIPENIDMGAFGWLMLGGLLFSIELSVIPQAIQRIDASTYGSLTYIVFPWGIFYGYFIFNDAPDRWTLLGAAIIIASGLFLIYREHKENSKLLKLEEEAHVTRIG